MSINKDKLIQKTMQKTGLKLVTSFILKMVSAWHRISERKSLLMEKKYWVSLVLMILAIAIIAKHAHFSKWEIGNIVTLIVEIGVGIGISIFVLGISRRNEEYVEKNVEKMSEMMQSEEDSKKARKKDVKQFLLKAFLMINIGLNNIKKYKMLLDQATNDSQRNEYFDKMEQWHKKNYNVAERCLTNPNALLNNFFNLSEVKSLESFFKMGKTYHSNAQDHSNFEDLSFMERTCGLWIKKLSKELKDDMPLKDLDGNKFAEQDVEKAVAPMSVSIDRTVYPLDSVVHISCNIESIQSGEKILCQVLDSDKNLLLFREIDPTDHDEYPKLPKHGLYKTSFTMEGSKWKLKDNYIVQAIYGTWFAVDSFTVDWSDPIVQCDQTAYTINSDMIITVIDSDANKNTEIIEYVGDREDSKLVIKSPYGKINGYRLRETGKSTGIFQGILRISGIRKDRTMIPQYIDGQKIDKIGGTGILDGCIAGTPGDELIATYTSKSGTAQINFYVSNFGAVIELDQKCYSPTDRVYITIVAPDFNFNSEKIDEIGENPESIVTIRTSCDSIEKYRLIETGPDTGIFTGAIQLEHKTGTGLQSQSSKSTVMKLFCRDNDFIEISFTAFNDEKFIAEATIQ